MSKEKKARKSAKLEEQKLAAAAVLKNDALKEQSEDGKEQTPKNLTEPDADDVQEEERKVTMN